MASPTCKLGIQARGVVVVQAGAADELAQERGVWDGDELRLVERVDPAQEREQAVGLDVGRGVGFHLEQQRLRERA